MTMIPIRKILVGLIFLIAPTRAFAIEGLPGYSWGDGFHDLGGDIEGSGAMGFVNQGIDWTTLPGNVTFDTYGEFRYRFRSLNQRYYNENARVLGIEFRRSPLRLGADYVWERFPVLHESSNKFQYYLSGYYGWDLKKTLNLQLHVQGLTGSTWDELTYDVDQLVGFGKMGYINQGIDWTTLPGQLIFNTFAEFRYRLRDKNNTYYNAYGPALGIELRRHPVNLDLAYIWQRYPGLGQYVDTFQLYLTYYFDWDWMHR